MVFIDIFRTTTLPSFTYLLQSTVQVGDPYFEDENIDYIDEITEIIAQKPIMNVLVSLVGENSTQRNTVGIIHKCQCDNEQPEQVDFT